eukprot:CAMPEP_0174263596 /NCGR_PEP_ID=MMETSP0439-20130205/19293_1 /TAXON_ID=0 /ORGANISM="Stereomyxa ramosa, Strain Chinc5" /LENGTH=135 /DNA_ID=CAMNT_0015349019 /DNA_START=24 /DNA_END=432 /DNA_ORIENTATION=+
MALFVGRIPPQARPRDLEDLFYKYGRISRCDVLKGYGFVEFDDTRDAEDALADLDGALLMGRRIVVEWAKGKRRTDSDDASTAAKLDTGQEIAQHLKETEDEEEEGDHPIMAEAADHTPHDALRQGEERGRGKEV